MSKSKPHSPQDFLKRRQQEGFVGREEQNPAIRDWVAERVEKGTLLWRESGRLMTRSGRG